MWGARNNRCLVLAGRNGKRVLLGLGKAPTGESEVGTGLRLGLEQMAE